MGKSPRPASIKLRAIQWLAQREHSREELRGKLLRLLRRSADGVAVAAAARGDGWPNNTGLSSGPDDTASDPLVEVDTLLAWLEAQGYLSQERFIESRVHARQSRFGNLRIRQELQQHGLTLDAGAQQDLQRSEFDRAHVVWRKKFATSDPEAPAADATAQARQMRFLAGRGFSIDVVRRVVKAGALSAEPEPDAEHGVPDAGP